MKFFKGSFTNGAVFEPFAKSQTDHFWLANKPKPLVSRFGDTKSWVFIQAKTYPLTSAGIRTSDRVGKGAEDN